jgi:hypothetical protein
MDFWHVALVGGVITWTACVFLRAVATRTEQLRAEIMPVIHGEETDKPATDETFTAEPIGPGVVTEIPVKPPAAHNGRDTPTTNGKTKPGTNGNGHAKVPLKRPGMG